MENKKEKIIKKILIGISILLVIVIIVIVLGGDRFKINFNDKKEDKIEDEVKSVTHISYDNLFSIDALSTWKEVEEKNSLNKKAIIELNDEDKCAYLVVVMTNKKDLDENYESYKKRVFNQKEQYYSTKIDSYGKTKIGESEAEYGEIYYTDPTQVKSYIRAYAVETENYYGQIVIWTLASNKEKVQDEFDNIISSFKEIKTSEEEVKREEEDK